MLIALACWPRQELDLPRRQAAHTSFLPADDRFLPNLAFMKQDLLGRQERMCPIAEGCHRASLRFLETLFEPTDWVAILLKSYESSRVAQHVGSVSEFRTERCLRWLHVMNARKYNVFVSVNSIVSGRRARTRDAIGTVRHVFLDADQDGLGVLSHIAARDDLPRPSYVLHSSPNHVHILWRAAGFDHASAECLQKHLARELRTDSAATAVTQMTRLPGFFNHKRAEPHLVTVEYYDANTSYAP